MVGIHVWRLEPVSDQPSRLSTMKRGDKTTNIYPQRRSSKCEWPDGRLQCSIWASPVPMLLDCHYSCNLLLLHLHPEMISSHDLCTRPPVAFPAAWKSEDTSWDSSQRQAICLVSPDRRIKAYLSVQALDTASWQGYPSSSPLRP